MCSVQIVNKSLSKHKHTILFEFLRGKNILRGQKCVYFVVRMVFCRIKKQGENKNCVNEKNWSCFKRKIDINRGWMWRNYFAVVERGTLKNLGIYLEIYFFNIFLLYFFILAVF